MRKAITYIRRSTDMQEASLDDQRQSIQAYADANDFRVVNEFCDDAISGKTVKARLGFQQMVDYARHNNGEDCTLLVYDVSRFGRFENPKEATYWEVELERNGVQVHYITEGFQNDGSLGSYITKVVKDAEASEYIKKLAKLTKRGIRSCTERGYWTGARAPYGYARAVVEPSTGEVERVLKPRERNAMKGKRIKLVPDEERIDTLRTIFDLYANKEQGLTSIVKYLHDHDIPSPSGKEFWARTTINNLLKNPAYLGIVALNKGTEEELLAKNAHEPLVDRDLFERTQERLQKFSSGKSGRYVTQYLLTRLIVCGQCESNVSGSTNKQRGLRLYRCSQNAIVGNIACGSPYSHAEDIETPVLNTIHQQIFAEEWVEKVEDALAYAIGESGRSLSSRLQTAQSEYEINQDRMQNLLEAIADGLPRNIAIQGINKIETRQENLEDIIAEIETKQQKGSRYQQRAEFLYTLPQNWGARFEQATPQEKKNILKMFLSKVTVYGRERRAVYGFYEFPNITDDDNKPPDIFTIEQEISRK